MSETIKQLESRLDGLKNATTTEKVDLMVELAWNIGYDNLRRTFDLNEQARKLAEKLSYESGLALARRNLGFYYYTQSDFAKALKKSFEALETFVDLKNKNEEANVLGIIGMIYWSLGNFELALDHLHKSEKLFKEIKNKERLPWTFTTLGGVYQNLGDTNKALTYHNKSLKLFRSNENKLGEARALSGLGTVYENEKKFERAVERNQAALKIFLEIKNELGESRVYNDLGSIHQLQGNFDEALKFHQASLRIRQKLGQKHAEITSLLNLGKLYIQIRDSEKALGFLQKALVYAKQSDAKPKLYQVHKALSEAHEQQGDLASALKHLKSFEKMKDKVLGDETKIKLKNMEIHFEVEKSQKEAEIHRLKNIELKQALDNLRETQVQLVQTEKMAVLGQITAGIAHEINNPIGAVKSSADVSIRGLKKIKQVLQQSNSIADVFNNSVYQKTIGILEKNSEVTLAAVERITNIINSLKNFARLDEAEYKKADLHEGIESTLTLVQHEIGKGIKIEKQFGKIPEINHFPNQLNQVFMTLLRNAIQAIGKKGVITIKTQVNGTHAVIKIADTGRGMPPEVHDSLFELGFTTKRSRVGVGMGLYTAYNIVQKHKGTIEVTSEVGKGTEFVIKLPLNSN
ncbi:tetratricopeptide repeat protein [candidate division KSB1 bacterium]|nr:tetratricopeptide repeat protein [candidate division KSB1 bacterium]